MKIAISIVLCLTSVVFAAPPRTAPPSQPSNQPGFSRGGRPDSEMDAKGEHSKTDIQRLLNAMRQAECAGNDQLRNKDGMRIGPYQISQKILGGGR
ncbi:MAG: hypothetical protein K8R92_00740 [Planctomycetes bacterium]|nr:hypothetical protein [Planctomycetota bacterium]